MNASRRTFHLREAIRNLNIVCAEEEQRHLANPDADRLEGLSEATKLLTRVTLPASTTLDRAQYQDNRPATPEQLAEAARKARTQMASQRKKT